MLSARGARGTPGTATFTWGDARPSEQDLVAGQAILAAGHRVFALVLVSACDDLTEGASAGPNAFLLRSGDLAFRPVPLLVREADGAIREVAPALDPRADRLVVLDRALEEIGDLSHEVTLAIRGRALPGEGLVQVFGLRAQDGLPDEVVGYVSSSPTPGVRFDPVTRAWSQTTPCGVAPVIPEVVSTAPATICARAQGLVGPTVLDQRRVLIIGAGSIGSEVARLLAPVVGRIEVVDRPGERLGPENLARHVLDLADAGREKAPALVDALRRQAPGLVAQAHTFDAREDPDRALDLLRSCDLVVVSTDLVSRQTLYAELAREARVPALFPWAYAWSDGGEVFAQFVDGPTWREVFAERVALGRDPLAHRPFRYADVSDQDALEGVPGLRVDLAPIAATAAAVALQLLDPSDVGRQGLLTQERPLVLLHAGRRPERLAHLFSRPFERIAVRLVT